jgi:lysophospholipase L1-like esterase
VIWQATGFRYGNAEMAPVHYRWEASADSTDGRDGHWRTVGGCVDNGLRVRADRVRLDGERWLRWQILAAGSDVVAVRELTVRPDAARRDVWFMLGDSITDAAFNAAPCPTLVGTVRHALPTSRPVVMDGGTQGDNARQGLAQWQLAAAAIPAGCWVGIGFGTNDAAQRVPPAVYAGQLQTMIDQVRRSGRTPLLARIPFSPRLPLDPYLAEVDRLARRDGLMAGPDLYGWFRAHPEELQADQVHPTPAGRLSIQRLWGEAIVAASRRRWSLAQAVLPVGW